MGNSNKKKPFIHFRMCKACGNSDCIHILPEGEKYPYNFSQASGMNILPKVTNYKLYPEPE